MSDLLVGLGVALVLEGLMWALAPHMAAKALQEIARSPPGLIRSVAWIIVGVGLAIVWSVRG